jgi:hypothetical protein
MFGDHQNSCWSANIDDDQDSVWIVWFMGGHVGNEDDDYHCFVRPVRSIK